ncbi:MAG: hypothetical protein H6953_02090 [Chromatiaceae bacterium]|nr:hypothetical protein [Chromatiaceae bacterium]MCP5313938.1 hypothetical protein [Chromatiaceae bacterium]
MNTDIQVLFVSDNGADELVLSTLLARESEGAGIRLSSVSDAQAFYQAIYSEQRYQVVVVDDRQPWSEWRLVVAACAQHRPNALLVLLTDEAATGPKAPVFDSAVTVAYPHSSSGLVALARLIGNMAVQERGFSLRHDRAESVGTAESAVEMDQEKLVYAVSHDLQDPLQLARRYADVLNEDYANELGEPGSKVLGHLQFNLNRTQEMLDELLDYSRLQNSKPEREPVDFNELLDEVSSLYKLTLQEIGGSISRHHSLPTLSVDRRQFQRVLQNLVGNAIKFRSERPLNITVRAQRVRNEWRIGVKDNGIGIAEDDTRRIFGMFERASGAEQYPGTGMGLAICKRIVQNHGGKIWVRSSPGSGSVFIFSVPQAEGSAEVVTS